MTIDTASVVTGDADRDQALPTDAFFAAAKFQQATYAGSHSRPLAAATIGPLDVLTLRGISRPLTLPFTLAITGPRARMTANLAINRLAFGVGQDDWRKTTVVPAAVSLTIAVNAQRR